MLDPQQILAQLDPQQRAAASNLSGPVAIRAGAGSGKTRTITHRIAYGVATGVYNPQRVAALSYTRKAANELSTRLHELGVNGVTSRTFHSLAFEQLQEFWPTVIGGERPTPVTSVAKLALVQQAAADSALAVSEAVARELVSEVEWRKVATLSYDAYIAAARTNVNGVSPQQVAEVMRAYEELKTMRRLIDFEDVIALTAGMFLAEPGLARQIQTRYTHYTVDEYQDISPLQYTLLQQWLGPLNHNLCVVGDASQTIFSFAGANQNFLLQFTTAYPDAVTLRLENNYRSDSAIVAVANNLMRDAPGALQLHAQRGTAAGGGSTPRAAWFQSWREEAQAVAAAIKSQLAAGAAPQQIAVLARTNQQLTQMAQVLRAQGIKAQLQEDPWLFSFPAVKRAVLGLRVAPAKPDKNVMQQVQDVLRAAGYSSKPLPDADAEAQRQQLARLLRVINRYGAGKTVPEIAALLHEMITERVVPEEDAVQLLPIHSAKGLEWHTVYVIGASEGRLPIKQALHSEAALAEEQRLAYVAFTRARQVLRISLSGQEEQGVQPSRFLAVAKIPVQRF